MADPAPFVYRPDPDPACCKAHGHCRTRSRWLVRIVRGKRVEERRYCQDHLDALKRRCPERVREHDRDWDDDAGIDGALRAAGSGV